MTSKSRLSNLFKGKSVHDLPTYTTPITKHEWTKNDDKLMDAVENQNVKKVTNLLAKKNLNPTKRGPLGRSAFHVACASGNKQILDIILPRSLDVNVTTIQGSTALQWAASKGHTYTVEKLLQTSANVNQRDSNEMTALHHACAGPHLNCVKVLLEGSADPHAKEMSGKTPLVYAAHRGDLEICRCLLERGVDINSQDRDHVTALMLAAKEGHANICEFLLMNGAKADLKDGGGNTAIKYAANTGLQEVFVAQAAKQERTQKEQNTQNEIKVEQSGDITPPSENSLEPLPSPKPIPAPRTLDHDFEKAYLNLKEENEQLNEEYSALARENLKLRDKFSSSQQKLAELRDKMNVEEAETSVEAVPVGEVKGLKEQLDLEKQKATHLEAGQLSSMITGSELLKTQATKIGSAGLEDDTTDGVKTSSNVEESHAVELMQKLQQQVLSLESENAQLKSDLADAKKATALPASADSVDNDQTGELHAAKEAEKQLQAEVVDLKQALEQQIQATSSASASALQHEQKSIALETQMGEARAEVLSLQKALEEAKAERSTNEAQRLDALLEKSKNIEDVNFDEEGFVEGRDMTKEEFLHGQNQQLRTQCGLLSEELEKLRATFDAILKAGDNLQADYDQQATEKEALQYDLELSLKEKAELAAENEFLLQDNNELHESLKQLVHELERMQEKLQTAQAQAEESRRGDVAGDVPSLLEERDALQARCSELEATTGRLQHDHGILVDEAQNLSETVKRLTSEREQMAAELEELELASRQQEGLQQEYNQLEVDYADLLKEKQALEQQTGQADAEGSSTESATGLRQDFHEMEKEKQQLETIVTGLSRLNVDLERKVSTLQEQLAQTQQVPNGQEHVAESLEGNNNNTNEVSQNEIIRLKKQVAKLSTENEEWEKRYSETVNTYRTHLLSAVQGHMDPDVKDALYHIIELRSMEQFC